MGYPFRMCIPHCGELRPRGSAQEEARRGEFYISRSLCQASCERQAEKVLYCPFPHDSEGGEH